MSTSKTILATAAVVTAICIPVGYYVSNPSSSSSSLVRESITTPAEKRPPTFENSALFREWQELHDKYGRTAEAMPAIDKAIAELKDPFRRRAFRAALIAEWVQLDAAGGFALLRGRQSHGGQLLQFLEEWLRHDARGAVDALLASRPGWEVMARDSLKEIARRVPGRLGDVVERLPKSDSYWDTKVRDAFAVMAEGSLASGKAAAEKITGPNREQALAGVAQAWAKSDLQGAFGWVKELPDVSDRDEIVRAALLGKATVDPATALDLVGVVPPGGSDGYYASTTGARVLAEAAKADYDATVAWVAAHPGRLSLHDMSGLAEIVTERLSVDAGAFFTAHAADGSLSAIRSAVDSALLNAASGQQGAVWDWLKKQPENETVKYFKDLIVRAIGRHTPERALQLVDDLPRSPEGDAQVASLAQSFFHGGNILHRFDDLLEQSPQRLREPLLEAAFKYLSGHSVDDPQRWIARLGQLPENFRADGTECIARAWAQQRLDEAAEWARSLDTDEARASAAAAVTSVWAAKDPHGAAEWIAAMPPGLERERSVGRLVFAIADQFPQEAWEWALTIRDPARRAAHASHVAKLMAVRDPATARRWTEDARWAADAKTVD